MERKTIGRDKIRGTLEREELERDGMGPRMEYREKNTSSRKKNEKWGQWKKVYSWKVKWKERSWSKTEPCENCKVRCNEVYKEMKNGMRKWKRNYLCVRGSWKESGNWKN